MVNQNGNNEVATLELVENLRFFEGLTERAISKEISLPESEVKALLNELQKRKVRSILLPYEDGFFSDREEYSRYSEMVSRHYEYVANRRRQYGGEWNKWDVRIRETHYRLKTLIVVLPNRHHLRKKKIVKSRFKEHFNLVRSELGVEDEFKIDYRTPKKEGNTQPLIQVRGTTLEAMAFLPAYAVVARQNKE